MEAFAEAGGAASRLRLLLLQRLIPVTVFIIDQDHLLIVALSLIFILAFLDNFYYLFFRRQVGLRNFIDACVGYCLRRAITWVIYRVLIEYVKRLIELVVGIRGVDVGDTIVLRLNILHLLLRILTCFVTICLNNIYFIVMARGGDVNRRA